MPPESPGNLIAIDLEWNNSRLECQVDRYDSGHDFLYASWNAIECPEHYVPISGGVAYVWVPEGYTHRRYRARVNDIDKGFEWRDVAQDPSGAMLILILPLDYVIVFPGEDAHDQFPVDFKSTEDGRMALYWWLQPGRFAAIWHMEYRQGANIEAECKRLREAWRRKPPAVSPVHIDRPPEQANVPSHQAPAINEPPEWHQHLVIHNIHKATFKGEFTMGDQYTIGQAGAAGPGAHAHDISFNQIWNQVEGGIDLPSLSEELALLRQEMKKEAKEPEHDVAVGAIAAAEQSAKAGNGPKTLELLKSAGKWTLSVAEKIGVGVAIAALKNALGN